MLFSTSLSFSSDVLAPLYNIPALEYKFTSFSILRLLKGLQSPLLPLAYWWSIFKELATSKGTLGLTNHEDCANGVLLYLSDTLYTVGHKIP